MRIVGRALQMYGPGYHHDHVNHPWFWLVAMLMVVAAIAVLIWALVRGFRPAYHVPASDPAIETLRMRFARGEIDSDEYATRSAQLSGVVPTVTPPPPPGPPAT